MGRRRELTNVADGVASQFCSRNNDYKGAWLPGVLCKARERLLQEPIVVDLLATTEDDILAGISARGASQIRRHCMAIGLPAAVVRTAVLTVRFEPRVPGPEGMTRTVPASAMGERTWWFTASVSIEDDLGRLRSASRREWCWPDRRELPVR